MKRLLIVGGVAGGASCAARARRLSEHTEIIIFERGEFVSFANCGLPYYVGNVITKEENLLVASPQMFKGWFNIEVRTENNVCSINREKKEIEVQDLKTGKIYKESYDKLLLSPGASPIKPKLDGIDLPGIFTLRNIADSRNIINWIKQKHIKRAVVVGGGFIGLEMVENLKRHGLDVSIIEMQPQVMPPVDPEIASFIHEHLKKYDISLLLKTSVTGFKQEKDGSIGILTNTGKVIQSDIVVLSIGVKPEIDLAKQAGLSIGKLGGIEVNEYMQTSDENIYAVGDAVQVKDYISGIPALIPLAGPANRQGRIVADVLFGKDPLPKFRGVQGTSICGILGLTVAFTGLSEKALKRNKMNEYEKIYLHPDNHAGYYPDAKTITMKLIFSQSDGKILGAQAVGMAGVDKRIDVISMAIQKNGTVFDLEEAELCYAPPYGSAKDPVNMAGMIASNSIRGYSPVAHWENINDNSPYIIDVRTVFEYSKSHLQGSINIPLHQIRDKISEIPKDREILTYCVVGKRSYIAARILRQYGFNAKGISGGFILYNSLK
ncbi:MAG: FAD-dependent oxidoreductase [Desulfobacterales bacterium]|nr:FAD-dependent oxidoreductase [Desulfobacterales bacterium]MBF0396679.1 FAD-dependent oxidoreductase [Desulfobacterales bacterium]